MADQTIAFKFSNLPAGDLADILAKDASPDTEQRLGLTLVLRKTLRRKLQPVSK